jgi:hypothetical protein
VFRKSHEPNFEEKFASSKGSDVQASKKKFATKGKGKKIIPQEILELPKSVTMVNYEVMTSKRDFDDLFEGINKRCSSRRFDLSLESRQQSSFQLDFSFEGLGRLLAFDST